MGSGWKDWEIGEVVEAADFQSYVQDQVVQYYDSTAARSSAIATATTGMVSFMQDTGLEYGYIDGTGDRWENIHTGGRNYIINGAFDIWQRGTAIVDTGGDLYTADRWQVDNRGGTVTTTRVAFTVGELEVASFGGSDYYANVDFDASNTNGRFDQKVEGAKTLAGQPVTLSFWAKSVDSSSITAQIIQSGTGTKLNSVASLTTSWQRFTFTTTLDSLAGETVTNDYLLVRILTSGETNFDIWGVQLEAGSVATPFRRHAPSLQGELAACQRYYYRATINTGQRWGNGIASTTTGSQVLVQFPVEMRVAPTAIEQTTVASDYSLAYSNVATTCTVVPSHLTASQFSALVSFGISPTTITLGYPTSARAATNGAFLGWSAEL